MKVGIKTYSVSFGNEGICTFYNCRSHFLARNNQRVWSIQYKLYILQRQFKRKPTQHYHLSVIGYQKCIEFWARFYKSSKRITLNPYLTKIMKTSFILAKLLTVYATLCRFDFICQVNPGRHSRQSSCSSSFSPVRELNRDGAGNIHNLTFSEKPFLKDWKLC